jgi:hypothetical protein
MAAKGLPMSVEHVIAHDKFVAEWKEFLKSGKLSTLRGSDGV